MPTCPLLENHTIMDIGLGCKLYNIFLGCFGYADDLFLLSASRSRLQAMVDICDRFAKARNLKFSTNVDPSKSKTKCIIFSKKQKDRQNVAPVLLNGDPLPSVNEVKHLGNLHKCFGTSPKGNIACMLCCLTT